VARVPGGECLLAAQGRVLEAEGGPGELDEPRVDRQLVVEEGGPVVTDQGLHDDEPVAPPLELLVRKPGGAQPLDAADLEVREVDGVVDVALRVDLGVTDAQVDLVRLYGLSTLEGGLAALDERAHALAGVLGREEEGELIRLVLEAADQVHVHRPVGRGLGVTDG
jgi:hypothetical protein